VVMDFVNDSFYEEVPDAPHACVWTVWSAFDALGTLLGFHVLTFF